MKIIHRMMKPAIKLSFQLFVAQLLRIVCLHITKRVPISQEMASSLRLSQT